jgi:hypothetical protein
MKRRSITRFAALSLVAQFAACATLGSPSRSTNEPPPTAPALPAASREHAPAPLPRASEQPEETEKPTRAAVPPPAPPTVPATTTSSVSVTLQDNDAGQLQAQSLLNDASARLARIDRSTLNEENAAVYTQASALTGAARTAMDQHDYLAASGLARKSLLLTGQLTTPSSPR